MAKSLDDVVVVDGTRTPFVKSGTVFQGVHCVDLGQSALSVLVERSQVPLEEVDEVIMGCVAQPSDAVNVARVVALRAGLPRETPAYTVQRNCASGLESVSTAFDKIRARMAQVVFVGGTESMSQAPLIFSQKLTQIFQKWVYSKTLPQKLSALKSFRFKDLAPRISLMEALSDPFVGLNMGQTAELLAKEFGVPRHEQDQWALKSHQRAVEASKQGRLSQEITPFYLSPDYKKIVEEDLGPRPNQTLEALSHLRPYFDPKTGTVTVGNSCPITDGAATLSLMRRDRAQSLGLKPWVSIRSYAYAGLEPERMGLGPVYASAKLFKQTGLGLADMGLVELNEAFAAQVLACQRAFESKTFAQEKLGLSHPLGTLDMDRVNVNGGAIALGHPVGATGARLILTLALEMRRRGVELGLATLCIGGGQGGALILENEL